MSSRITRAEAVLGDHVARLQSDALKVAFGRECEALIDIVRAVDHAAYALTLSVNHTELLAHDMNRRCMIRGIAPALCPFLKQLQGRSGGIRWLPTSARRFAWADQYLIDSGILAGLRRLAAGERYGLCETQFLGPKKLVITTNQGIGESIDGAAERWLSGFKRIALHEDEHSKSIMSADEAARRLDKYIDVADGWFIRYGSDVELEQFYHYQAEIWSYGTPEGDALPDRAQIAGRPFAEWRSVSVTACGRVMRHIACATRLARNRPELDLRNLLTLCIRKDDLMNFWLHMDEPEDDIQRIISYLALTGSDAADFDGNHEVPVPYYVEMGTDFVMMPVFGALLNAQAGLIWALRNNHRDEWNNAAQTRESKFRDDLRIVFPGPRFEIVGENMRIYRPDGSVLTDIDAVLFDRETNNLALIQLKWYDIVGFSLRERDSRRLSVLSANKWVRDVSAWIADRTATEVAQELRLTSDPGAKSPLLFVIVRHGLHFSASDEYDSRAAWISWPDVVRSVATRDSPNLLQALTSAYRGGAFVRPRRRLKHETYSLPGLTVELRTRA